MTNIKIEVTFTVLLVEISVHYGLEVLMTHY